MKATMQISVDEHLEKIETDLQAIKSMLSEALTGKKEEAAQTDDRIMNVQEAAAFLGMEKHALYAKCSTGDVPSFRMGKLIKFKRSELAQWLEAQGMGKKLDTEAYADRYLQKHVLKG